MRTVKPFRLALIVFFLVAWVKVAHMLHESSPFAGWLAPAISAALMIAAWGAMFVAREAFKDLYNWVCPPK